jgi:hypothetical protein
MSDLLETFADTAQSSSAQAWFVGGERVGYGRLSRAIVAKQDAPLRIFLRREGDPARAVSFLPGLPDGSFSNRAATRSQSWRREINGSTRVARTAGM